MRIGEADLAEPVSPEPAGPAPGGPSAAQRLAVGIAQGAALIAGLTMLSRILGLVRTLVFSQTVGSGCLGSVYVTAYQVPNLVSELVLAGALTNAMVPVLARSAERARADPAAKERVGLISSALLTWTVLILVPVAVVIAVEAGPIASLLNPVNASSHCVRSEMVHATAGMLQVFAPQAVLYGLSVVVFGMLQAYRRFTGPALAPVIASLVMIASYLVFVPLDGGLPLARAPLAAELVLSVGTTLSVAGLVIVGLLPMRRLGLRIRPVLRFPPGLARRVGGLAFVGILEFIANDVAAVVIIILANGHGDTGAIVVFNYATLVFNGVTAVLTLSVTTSAFPVMSSRDGADFDRTCAGSTRAILLLSWLGTAAMAAVAVSAAHVLVHADQVRELVEGFAMFAPGIAGTSVITNLSRVMFALGRLKVAAWALVGNWVVVVAVDALLTQLVPARWEVAALALGNTIGQTAVAIPLTIVTARIRGRSAIDGVGHAALSGLGACVAGSAAGVAVTIALGARGKLMDMVVAVIAASCAVIAFAVVAYVLDRRDLRTLVRQLRRRGARLRPRPDSSP